MSYIYLSAGHPVQAEAHTSPSSVLIAQTPAHYQVPDKFLGAKILVCNYSQHRQPIQSAIKSTFYSSTKVNQSQGPQQHLPLRWLENTS